MIRAGLEAGGGRRARVLIASVVVVATSGMIYELVASALASYVLGNAVLQFSLVLGLYLSAMGVGAMISQRLSEAPPGRGQHEGPQELVRRFIQVETCVALVGGTSAALLFLAFAHVPPSLFRPFLYGEVLVMGVLVGIELPLLLRLLRETLGFEESVVQAMTFDYLGSLVASVLFPLVLMPFLGLVRTAALAGMVNAGVAWVGAKLIAEADGQRRVLVTLPVVVAIGLSLVFGYGEAIVRVTAD